jgi:light-regulated signal transduction histidine kinase (bacteriophytochrome)
LKENIEEPIRFIQTAVGRLARIIDALLRLSRAGRVEYQCQTTPVVRIVQKVVEALDGTISSKHARVDIGDLPPAWSDPTAVEQIFANLIANSVQYLDPERSGRIEVGWNEDPGPDNLAGFHVYFVKDNGLGIPEAYHQRVFTPFNRLHANVAQGEGIGLSLVRRVVERLGGKIWLQSAAGVGSTFFVALPSRARADAQSTASEENRTPPKFRGA